MAFCCGLDLWSFKLFLPSDADVSGSNPLCPFVDLEMKVPKYLSDWAWVDYGGLSKSAWSLALGRVWVPSGKKFIHLGIEAKYLLDLASVLSGGHQYPAVLEDMACCWRLVPKLGYPHISAPPSVGEWVMTLQWIASGTVELLGYLTVEDVNLGLPWLLPCFWLGQLPLASVAEPREAENRMTYPGHQQF